MAAAVLSAALAPLNSTMVAVALPQMSHELSVGSGLLRHGLVTSYLLSGIVLQSLGGKLADRVGYRRALGYGQLVFAAAALLGFFLPVFGALCLARVTMAAAGAIIVPSAIALLRNELPPERRGRAFGAFGAVMATSAALGPQLGALLAGYWGWSSIFLVNVPWLALCAIPAWLGRRAPAAQPSARPSRFDLVGSLLLGASLSALVIGSQAAALRLLMLAGGLGLVAFALWERRTKEPLIDLALFTRPALSAGGLIIALHNLVMYSLLFELPQVTGRLFSGGPEAIGSALSMMMVSMVVAAPIAGRLSDRVGARVMTLAGCLAGLCGVIALGVVPLSTVPATLPGLILLGLGLGLGSAPAQAAAMSAVPREQSGMAAGLTSTLRYIGGITGLAVLGALLGEQRDAATVLSQHHAALWVFGAALVATALCALALPRRLAPAAS